MKRSLFGVFIDNTVLSIFIIILCFIFFKQFIANSLYCLALSILISGVFVFTIISAQSRKLNRLSLKTKELADVDSYNIALRKLTKKEQMGFFSRFFENSKVISEDALLISENTALFVKLEHDTIESQDIFSSISQCLALKIENIIIICNQVDNAAIKLADVLEKNITFLTPIETYAMMKNHNIFPETNAAAQKKKGKFNFIKSAFMRNKAKNFLKIGLLLFLLSFFVPFSKFYIISASVSMLIGVVCLLFGKRKIVASELPKELKLKN